MRPERPSIMTLRTWPMVSPTRAMRCERRSAMGSVSVACARTHSAPARVLPEPRPPSRSQVCQGSPLGGTSVMCPLGVLHVLGRADLHQLEVVVHHSVEATGKATADVLRIGRERRGLGFARGPGWRAAGRRPTLLAGAMADGLGAELLGD